MAEVARLAASAPGSAAGEAEGVGGCSVAMIVPAYRDTPAVHTLLDATKDWSPSPARIVVVSGEPDDALERLCVERRHAYIEGPPCRGAQLDLGARAADSHVLWFVHADAAVPPGAIAAIRRAVAQGAESGCFGFAFQGEPAWHKTVIERLVALRLRLGGIPYGDQALFATRSAYRQGGGFAHRPLFEEVPLVRALKQRGTFVVLPERVGVSTRRWERDGWLARSLHNRWLALEHALGVPSERLARAYGHGQDRKRRRNA